MTNRNSIAMSLADFEHLLEVYGADRTRWPIASRAAAAACLASNQAARRLLVEAEALDAVMLKTVEPSPAEVSALADRIVSAARATPRLAARSSQATAATTAAALATPVLKVAPRRDWVRAAALLAASLVLGIFAGQSQLGARAVPALQDLASLTSPTTADRLAMLDLHIEAVDED